VRLFGLTAGPVAEMGLTYVAFEYVPNAPKPTIDWSRDPLELPVASGSLPATGTRRASRRVQKTDPRIREAEASPIYSLSTLATLERPCGPRKPKSSISRQLPYHETS
jgi:hypothetical protein